MKLTKDDVTEIVKSIRNRCDIYILIKDNPMANHLLPTLLEDLHSDSQAIIEGFCVDEKND